MRGNGEWEGGGGCIDYGIFGVGQGGIVKHIYMQIWRLNQHIAFPTWSRSVLTQ